MTTEQWADRINAARHKSIESILAVGRMLIDAKTELGHGNFHRLFRGQPNAVTDPVPMDVRMGEYYMAVAERFGSINTKLVSFLPTSVSILYVLSQLDSDVLESLIDAGLLHPGLTRKQARALVRPVGTTEPPWSWEAAEQRVRHAINAEIVRMPSEARKRLPDLLRHLTAEFEQRCDAVHQAAVAVALYQLAIHDAEPGGFRILADDATAALYPGWPLVLGGVKSTHASWYKDLTTKKPGVTPLTRQQVERRLQDQQNCLVRTKRTAQTDFAVECAIQGLGRHAGAHDV
jgi:hypothetical protein